MASEKQIAANRRNALLSTGPRSPEGRAASRLNSYQHGLTGHLEVMTAEQKQARDAFIAGMVDDLKPVGALERQLAHSFAGTQWRLNRIDVIENNIFAADAWNQEADRAAEREENALVSDPDRRDTQLPDGEPDIDRGLASARTFLRNPERFHLLAIYETRLHRKAQSDLKQLQDLQAARAVAAEKQKAEERAEAARTKAAEEKENADAEARRAAALQESVWLQTFDKGQGKTIDPDGKFQHPNGFVFSTGEVHNIARLAYARASFHNMLKEAR